MSIASDRVAYPSHQNFRQRCRAHVAKARHRQKLPCIEHSLKLLRSVGSRPCTELRVYVLISTSVTYLSPYLHAATTFPWNFKHAASHVRTEWSEIRSGSLLRIATQLKLYKPPELEHIRIHMYIGYTNCSSKFDWLLKYIKERKEKGI